MAIIFPCQSIIVNQCLLFFKDFCEVVAMFLAVERYQNKILVVPHFGVGLVVNYNTNCLYLYMFKRAQL